MMAPAIPIHSVSTVDSLRTTVKPAPHPRTPSKPSMSASQIPVTTANTQSEPLRLRGGGAGQTYTDCFCHTLRVYLGLTTFGLTECYFGCVNKSEGRDWCDCTTNGLGPA